MKKQPTQKRRSSPSNSTTIRSERYIVVRVNGRISEMRKVEKGFTRAIARSLYNQNKSIQKNTSVFVFPTNIELNRQISMKTKFLSVQKTGDFLEAGLPSSTPKLDKKDMKYRGTKAIRIQYVIEATIPTGKITATSSSVDVDTAKAASVRRDMIEEARNQFFILVTKEYDRELYAEFGRERSLFSKVRSRGEDIMASVYRDGVVREGFVTTYERKLR